MLETFEQALQANWNDPSTHHAYADWLIEQGDPRGEFARCQLLLENPALSVQQRQELQTREQELLEANGKKWVGDIRPKNPAHFLPEQQCRVEFCWRRGWLTGLRCHQLHIDTARKIAQSPEIRFLRDLEVVTDGVCGTLRKSDRLTGFPYKQFEFPNHRLPYSIYPLALSPHLGNVRRLTVGWPVDLAALHESDPCFNVCRSDALIALLSRLPRVEHVVIAQVHYHSELVERFSLAGPLPELRELELSYLPSSDISLLLQSPALNHVRRLTLHASIAAHRNGGTATFRNLSQCPFSEGHLGALESLCIIREACGDQFLAELVSSPVFPRLRELSVIMSHVTETGAEVLLGAQARSSLIALDLSFGIFSPAVQQRLREAYPFLVAHGVTTPEQHLQQQQQQATEQQALAEMEWE